ncbi:MAG: polysaccharide biosynthesis C-terminal domain-containing protein, partial [Clostridia bacterium]|nr:polysaccharide biosynthesis C-terminal domain-containing protein [Clostridia bacterium]
MPLVFGYNAVSSVLRGMGDSRHPLLFIGIAALSNLILDLVFVICLHMGALGTALATVIGQGLAFFFAVVYLYRRREAFAFDFQPDSFRIRTDKLKIMMGIGVPMALQTLFIQ